MVRTDTASFEAVHVSGDQAAWKGEWATKVNSHSSALDDLEQDRIEDSADDHIARSDERAAAVRTYSLAHNAERKTRDDAVDEFWRAEKGTRLIDFWILASIIKMEGVR